MPTARHGLGAAVIGNSIYVISGGPPARNIVLVGKRSADAVRGADLGGLRLEVRLGYKKSISGVRKIQSMAFHASQCGFAMRNILKEDLEYDSPSDLKQ